MKLSKILKWVNQTITKYDKALYILMILSAISNTVFVLVFALFPKYVISIMTSGSGNPRSAIEIVILFSVVVFLSKVLISYTNEHCSSHYMRCRMKIIGEMGKHFMNQKFYDIESPQFLDLSQKADTAVNGCSPGYEAVLSRITLMGGHLFTCVISLVAILTFKPLLVVFILAIVLLNRFINEKFKYTEKELMDAMVSDQRKSDYFFDLMSDFQFGKEIRIYHFSMNIFEKFQNAIINLRAKKKQIYKNSVYVKIILSIISMIQEVAIYVVTTYAVLQDEIDIGSYLTYIALVAAFSIALNLVMEDFIDLKYQSMYVHDLINFFDLVGKKDTEGNRLIQDIDLTSWKIQFDHVSFKYPNTDRYILKDFSIKIHQGEKIAVTGLNGAGKTTFIKLLTRLYDPVEGRILINNVDVQTFDRDDYYTLFAPLFQEVFMFPFSVNENIALEDREKIDYKKVKEKVRAVGMLNKINSLPNGMDTVCLKILDDEGIQFSGGEQQKLLMARTLYKSREIFIFDEPTAALDSLAEDKIYNDFNDMTKGKTAIFITHRLASTRFCDIVYVFENGHVIEQGTHESLMALHGEYCSLYELQAKNYEMEDCCK